MKKKRKYGMEWQDKREEEEEASRRKWIDEMSSDGGKNKRAEMESVDVRGRKGCRKRRRERMILK